MNEQTVAGLLGLAMRARQLQQGAGRALEQVRQEGGGILLIDEGASANTLKRFQDACEHHRQRICHLPQGLMGRALGNDSAMVAWMLPGGLADQLMKTCPNEENSNAG